MPTRNRDRAGAFFFVAGKIDSPDVRRTASRRPQIDGRANAVQAETSGDRRRQFSITAARSSRPESSTAGPTARPTDSRENEP